MTIKTSMRPLFERRHIRTKEGAMYMRRWCLNVFGVSLRLHRFHEPDNRFHDHPFDFMAVTLWGKAKEALGTPDNHVMRKVRLFVPRFYKADSPHCVVECLGMWTLVVTGRFKRLWGFYTEDGWVPWHEIDTWNIYRERR